MRDGGASAWAAASVTSTTWSGWLTRATTTWSASVARAQVGDDRLDDRIGRERARQALDETADARLALVAVARQRARRGVEDVERDRQRGDDRDEQQVEEPDAALDGEPRDREREAREADDEHPPGELEAVDDGSVGGPLRGLLELVIDLRRDDGLGPLGARAVDGRGHPARMAQAARGRDRTVPVSLAERSRTR